MDGCLATLRPFQHNNSPSRKFEDDNGRLCAREPPLATDKILAFNGIELGTASYAG